MGATSEAYSNLSLEHKIAFGCINELTALCAIVANALYIYCYMRDQKFKCCFHMFLANIAFCDMLMALAALSLGTLLMFRHDVISCALYTTVVYLANQEMALMLLVVSFDRIQLIKGVSQYRHVITSAISTRLVGLTWLFALAVCIAYSNYKYALHGSLTDYNVHHSVHCYAFPTYYLNFGAVLQLAIDVVLVAAYVYVLYLCHHTQVLLSSLIIQDSRRKGSDFCRPLAARDSAAYGLVEGSNLPPLSFSGHSSLSGSSKTTKVSLASTATTLETTSAHKSLQGIPESSNEEIGEDDSSLVGSGNKDYSRRSVAFVAKSSGGMSSGTSHSTTGTGTTMGTSAYSRSSVGGSDIKHLRQTSDGSNRSILRPARDSYPQAYETDNANVVVPGGAGAESWMKGQGNNSAGPGTPDNVSEMVWPFPMVKSILPYLLVKPTSSNSLRSDAMAAQQLGLFLLVKFAAGIPLYLSEVLEGLPWFSKETPHFLHWLYWLMLLRACVFPVLYCLYSYRLRSFFSQVLCPKFCRRRGRVSPDGVTSSSLRCDN